MKREEAVEILTTKPYLIGHKLGFTKLTEIHNEWILDMVLGEEDDTLQGHRGSYKTTCLSLALTFLIILAPNKRILFLRKTETDVIEIVKQVKNFLRSDYIKYLVRAIYGVELKLAVESATEICTNLVTDYKGTSQLKGYGIDSSITGKHYDIIFTDDIINTKDRYSKAEREKTKRVYIELQNVKNDGGRIFNSGTPWHEDDAFTLMPEPRKFDCYTTGIMSEEAIQKKRDEMPPSQFSANYELKHIASEDIIFTNPQTGYDQSLCLGGIAHLDSAFHGADWTALSIVAKKGGNYFVYGRCWDKHVEDCYDEIIAEYRRFLALKIYAENNADKGFVLRDLKNKGGLRTSDYAETMNKYHKITTYLKSAWKDVYFVEGTDEEYIKMITDYNEFADHDDCPDSLASAIRKLYRKKK